MTPLYDREAELAEIRRHVGAPMRRVVVLAGVPGIGTSALLRVAVHQAEESVATTLTANGSPVAGGAPYDALRRLFAPLARLRAVDEAPFDGPGEVLRRIALGEPAPADSAAVAYAVHWALDSLADAGGVIVALDDVPWIDGASGQALAGALAHLADDRVLVVATRREATATTVLDGALLALADAVVTPSPLGLDAVAELLGSPDDAARVLELSGGVPFFVTELATSLASGGELHPPARTRAAIGARLDQLGEGATAVARAVAVLGPEARPALVARVTGLDRREVDDAVRALAADGVLDPAPDDVLRCAHPLVEDAVLDGLGRAELHEARDRAARLLRDEGVPAGRIAGLLLQDEPGGEPWRVDVLLQAAGEALASGGAGSAIALLDRAREEAVDPVQRDTTRAMLGGALLATGRAAEAAAVWEERLAESGHARARILMDVGDARYAGADYLGAEHAYREALGTLAASGVAPTDPLGLEAASRFAVGRLTVQPLADVIPRAVLAELRARPAEADGIAERRLFAASALSAHSREEWDLDPAALAARAYADGAAIVDGFADDPTTYLLSGALYLGERFDDATTLLGAAIDDARRRARATSEMSARFTRGAIRIIGGDLAGGVDDLDASVGLGVLSGTPFLYYVSSAALLVRYSHLAGDPERAASVLALIPPDQLLDSHRAIAHLAEAEHALLSGDADAALPLAVRAGRLDDDGIAAWTFSWRTIAASAALDLGDRDRARELAAEELGVLERRRIPAAARIDAVLLGARLESDEAAHASLTSYLAGLPERHEWQAALVLERLAALDLAVDRPEQAAERLLRSLRVAREQGLAPLEQRVRRTLRRLGREPLPSGFSERLHTLTPSETRVATRAVAGATNRDIARELFVTLKTVEFHLARVYRKFGVTSRGELAEVFAAGDRSAG